MNEIDKKVNEIIFSKKYQELKNQIYSQYSNVFPEESQIFRAFELCPLSKTKVIIFGQDPYYQKGVADGLAFSSKNLKTPPSLKNIFKEIKIEYPNSSFKTNDLSSWAIQGVLLLNFSLTVEENKPMKMIHLWKDFIKEILDLINVYCSNIIFVLWGNNARKLKNIIDLNKHFILESSHPSPLSFNKGFLRNNHFKKINEILIKLNIKPINWNT